MKKWISLLLAALFLLAAGCADHNVNQVTATSTVSRDTKYNSATVALTPEEFENAGFQLGDSCDIEFGNGYSITDVPYYNGYYVKNNAPVIVAYPGFSNISITYNNFGIWDTAKLTDRETVVIRLREAGKYSAVQDTLGQVYPFDYTEYESSEEFCNFRTLSGGNLKDNFLFRGASPVDNSRNRAPYTDQLLKNSNISYVVDLADTKEDMEKYLAEADFNSPYASELYENGKIALLGMSSSYQADDYKQKVAAGFREMLQASGPVYIHCMEGKDRTGFVCMLLEALAGATYEEMQADYMMTYQNYYSVSLDGTPEKYNAISALYFDAFVSYLHGTENLEELKQANYVQDATDYLISGGMTAAEVEQVRAFITK